MSKGEIRIERLMIVAFIIGMLFGVYGIGP